MNDYGESESRLVLVGAAPTIIPRRSLKSSHILRRKSRWFTLVARRNQAHVRASTDTDGSISSSHSNVYSRDEYDSWLNNSTTEEALLQQIKRGARALRRLAYHTRQVAQCPTCHGPAVCGRGCRDSKNKPRRGIAMGSDPGFPDLVLPAPPVLWIAELKAERGRMSDQQEAWQAELQACNTVQYRVWRPRDRDEINTILATRS